MEFIELSDKAASALEVLREQWIAEYVASDECDDRFCAMATKELDQDEGWFGFDEQGSLLFRSAYFHEINGEGIELSVNLEKMVKEATEEGWGIEHVQRLLARLEAMTTFLRERLASTDPELL